MSFDLQPLFDRSDCLDRRYAASSHLFHAGDEVTVLYMVREGGVHLLRHTGGGAPVVLQHAGPGDVVAEASLYSLHYHCAAQAASDVLLAAMPVAAMRARLATDTNLAELWAKHLAREVQAARLRSEIRSLRTVAERLDAWLGENDWKLPPKGNWRDMAAEIGVTSEALYRELAVRRRGNTVA
ncbi:MAG: Crp/Fnr family transcriptional regulator [Allorhizobium sp.]